MGATSRRRRRAPEGLSAPVPAGPLSRARVRRGTAFAVGPLLASCLSGCILPLAPEFQAVDNAQPIVVKADPPIGSDVQNEEMAFAVTLRDPNPGDRLYARWLVDYPRSETPAMMPGREDVVPPPEDPTAMPDPIRFKPDCVQHAISNASNQHRLMLVVSDRPFIKETDPKLQNYWDSIPSSAGWVRSVWVFRKACR